MNRRLVVLALVICLILSAVPGALASTATSDLYDTPGFPFESVEDGARHGYPTDLRGITPRPVPDWLLGRMALLAGVSGTMLSTTTVKGGPGSSYASLGTINSGTAVTVIEYHGSYYFIEYGSPLRRGYVLQSTVSCGGGVPAAQYDINYFGLNVSGGTLTVRAGPSSSYASIGSIANREIVTAFRIEGSPSSWWFFEYWTSGGNKRGYVQSQYLHIPGCYTSEVRPIRSGTRSQDYSAGHPAIDIGAPVGTSLYAVQGGVVEYSYRYHTFEGVLYTVSYGNMAELQYGNQLALYAHMSQFAGGYQACQYPNYRLDYSPYTEVPVGSLNVSQNASVGKSGQSGNCLPSGGAHLHFELYEGGVRQDPFTYVLFAKMPK